MHRLLLASLLAMSPLLAAAAQTLESFEHTLTRTVGYKFLLHLPTGYDAKADRVWPLMVFLHGAGERGSDPWLVAKHGPPKLLQGDAAVAPAGESAEAKARREEATSLLARNFIVVSPQCPAGTRWDDDAVLALADHIAARHKVDPRRVYLTGLSMGGFGTWSLGLKNPGRFAALAPICGGGQRIDVLLAGREQRAALQSLGVWAFHGAKDPVVTLDESERMVAALRLAGVSDLTLTVYPEAKHDSWTESYANPELYTWLLKHRR